MGDNNDVHDVNRIDTLAQTHLDVNSFVDPLESFLVNPRENIVNESLEVEFLHSMLETTEVLEING